MTYYHSSGLNQLTLQSRSVLDLASLEQNIKLALLPLGKASSWEF